VSLLLDRHGYFDVRETYYNIGNDIGEHYDKNHSLSGTRCKLSLELNWNINLHELALTQLILKLHIHVVSTWKYMVMTERRD